MYKTTFFTPSSVGKALFRGGGNLNLYISHFIYSILSWERKNQVIANSPSPRKILYTPLISLVLERFGQSQYKFKRVPNTGLCFAFLIKLCFISNIDLGILILLFKQQTVSPTIIIYTTSTLLPQDETKLTLIILGRGGGQVKPLIRNILAVVFGAIEYKYIGTYRIQIFPFLNYKWLKMPPPQIQLNTFFY